MTTHHVATAVAHLEAVAATRETLTDLYDQQRRAKGAYEAGLGVQIAEAHQAIGYGLKAAADHAAVAQAMALERIGDLLAAHLKRTAPVVVNAPEAVRL